MKRPVLTPRWVNRLALFMALVTNPYFPLG